MLLLWYAERSTKGISHSCGNIPHITPLLGRDSMSYILAPRREVD